MITITNAPRRSRSQLGRLVRLNELPLYLLNPKQHTHSSGGYRYATEMNGEIVLLGKSPIPTEDEGFRLAKSRWGQEAKKYNITGELRVVKTENGKFQLAWLNNNQLTPASEEYDKQKNAVSYGQSEYGIKAKRLLRNVAA